MKSARSRCVGSVLLFPSGSEKAWHALGFAQKTNLSRSLTKDVWKNGAVPKAYDGKMT